MAEESSSGIEIVEQSIEERLRYNGTNTSLHQKLLSRLIARRRLSERAMSRRYDSWNRVDEHVRLYIDLSRGAKKGDNTIDNEKKEIPWARSIVVPISYAIQQVYMTQLMGIFTRRDPPLEIHGVGPEDVRPAKLMNAVIAYDQVITNYVLELYTAVQDAMKYGMGGAIDWWEDEYGWKVKRSDGMMEKMLSMLGMPTSRRVWGKRKEYQSVEAFDPFLTFPDPRISLSKVQKGEFFFTRLYRGYLELLANTQENGGNYFNVDAIPKTAPKPQSVRSRNRFQISQMNLVGSMDERDKGFHAIDSGIVRLIPEEWELGDGDRPEKWHFAWVDDTVIIRAHRFDPDHDEFNASVLESNIDTHVFGNQGSIENMDGLQRFMCYSEDTEILTERGWSRFRDLTETDKVATVSADADRKLSFEKPNGFAVYDFDGEMVHLGGNGARRRFDLLVTPNHRTWIQKRKAKRGPRVLVDGNVVRKYEDQWWTEGEFTTADKMRPWFRIPNTVSWDGGVDRGSLILPGEASPIGRPGRPYKYPPLSIPYDVLAPFIGWYVSEGSTCKGDVLFGQKNPEFIPILDELLTKRFPKKFHRGIEGAKVVRWRLHDIRLARWLRENCGHGTANKKIPALAYNFSQRLCRLVLEAAVSGDGHKYRDNLEIYHSTSKELIDGLQVLALKSGFEASVRARVSKQSDRHAQAYHMNLVRNGESRQAAGVNRVPYKGKVYCVENSTHLLVVRRNGSVAVCGNTWMMNSHVQNIIRFINNRMIYSSEYVESFDVENPDAAMHVRLTALGNQMLREGRLTIPQMIYQLQLTDVTQGMLRELTAMREMVMEMSGAADQMMGRQTRDKRTLGEVQRLGNQASVRMAMHAMMMDVQGLRPLALRWVSNRQQYTSEEMYVRVAGRVAEEFGGERVRVRPEDLYGHYDYTPKTGPQPPEPGDMAEIMLGGLESVMKSGIVAIPDRNGKILDPHEILKEAMRDKGVRNIEDFYRPMGGRPGQQPPGTNVEVLPDEEVERQKQAGNVVPIETGGRRPMRGGM